MILVGAGGTTKKDKYAIKSIAANFDQCAAACMNNSNCLSISSDTKSKCTMFGSRFYEIRDANHVVFKTKDNTLWYDRVCLPQTTTLCDVIDAYNGLSVAFHQYHLAQRVADVKGHMCSQAKLLDDLAGYQIYGVPVSGKMTHANIKKTCNECGLLHVCFMNKGTSGHYHTSCNNHDNAKPYQDASGFNKHNQIQTSLSYRLCKQTDPRNCVSKMKVCTSLAAWSSDGCCNTNGWCGRGDQQSNLDALCFYHVKYQGRYKNIKG